MQTYPPISVLWCSKCSDVLKKRRKIEIIEIYSNINNNLSNKLEHIMEHIHFLGVLLSWLA